AHYRERFGSDHDDYERLLRNWKLASQDEHAGLSPTVAGLLLFAKNEKTQHYIGGARIDLAAYDSVDPDTDARIDSTTFGGTVMNQLDEVTNYLRTSPFLSTPSNKDDLGRVDRPIYSMRALQEAVVNAVAHRDYAVAGSQCRLQIFTDRIEVTSPGRLQNYPYTR
ncbi:transcriptional regulator, partial [mine drainage metagenome]